jgi:hypothetical protein
MRARTLFMVAAFAALLTGCGAPSAALLPSVEPRGEVLSYFAPDTPALVVIDTDPDGEGARAIGGALAQAGALGELRRRAKAHGLVFAQVRRLLGHELAIGIPYRGAPPLAVLVARHGDDLRTLAASRVVGHRATVAGRYRGADLYAARDHAFALRGRVLLISRSTYALKRVLDRRADGEAIEEDDLAALIPDVDGKPLARGILDAGARVHGAARAVPWLGAWESLGAVLHASDDGATLDFRLGTAAADLLEVDVPVSPGERGPLAVTAKAPSVTVRDLAHVLGVAERALRAAAPIAALRLDLARRTLRHGGGVDLDAEVLARLHGPATLIRSSGSFSIRADPSRPLALRRALDRLARALPAALRRAHQPGWKVRSRGGFFELRHGRAVAARFGMVGDALVGGTASPASLRALARAPLARPAGAAGALTVAVPPADVARWARTHAGAPVPWRLNGWARGEREALRGAITLGW